MIEGPLDFGPRANESKFAELNSDFGDLDTSLPVPQEALQHRGRRSAVPSWLPFTVGIVQTDTMLLKIQALRAIAYGRHLPEMAASFGEADPLDTDIDVTVFYAQDTSTECVVGTARLQTNRSGPLVIERSLILPSEKQGRLLGEITRLAVLPGYTPPVRLALVKALHLFCVANQIEGIVAGSRRSLLRQYENIGFSDLYGDYRTVPLAHAGGLAHRILFRDTVTSEAESRARCHPDYDFVFRTYHPGIDVVGGRTSPIQRGLRIVNDSPYSSKAA